MQVAESAQQGTKIRTGATLDQETSVHKTVEHVSDVSEGTMVHDLAPPPRIHPPFEDVIRLKHDTITHDQNTLRVVAAVSNFAVRFFRKSDLSWFNVLNSIVVKGES